MAVSYIREKWNLHVVYTRRKKQWHGIIVDREMGYRLVEGRGKIFVCLDSWISFLFFAIIVETASESSVQFWSRTHIAERVLLFIFKIIIIVHSFCRSCIIMGFCERQSQCLSWRRTSCVDIHRALAEAPAGHAEDRGFASPPHHIFCLSFVLSRSHEMGMAAPTGRFRSEYMWSDISIPWFGCGIDGAETK